MPTELDQIRPRVIRGLANATKLEVVITDDTRIVRDLDIDSLAVMNLILLLEDEFDISMPLERVAEIETVKDLVDTVGALVGEAG